jgi:hypothetical protein
VTTTALALNGVMGPAYGSFLAKTEVGVIIRATGLTAPLSFGPYVRTQYGSFSRGQFPDFLHGTLNLCVPLTGDIRMSAHVDGDVVVKSHLTGNVEVNP